MEKTWASLGQAGRDPAGQGGLQGGRVDAAQQTREHGLDGAATAREAEGQEQFGAVVVAETGESAEGTLAHEEAEGDQAKDGDEGVSSAVEAAGVWDGGEGFGQGD